MPRFNSFFVLFFASTLLSSKRHLFQIDFYYSKALSDVTHLSTSPFNFLHFSLEECLCEVRLSIFKFPSLFYTSFSQDRLHACLFFSTWDHLPNHRDMFLQSFLSNVVNAFFFFFVFLFPLKFFFSPTDILLWTEFFFFKVWKFSVFYSFWFD